MEDLNSSNYDKDGQTQNKKQKSKEKTKLPIASCPGCENSIYPIEIIFACEKCSDIYYVPVSMIDSYIHFCKADTKSMNSYLVEFFNKKKILDLHLSSPNAETDKDEEKRSKYDVSFGGEVLEILKQVKKVYGFKNLGIVMHFVFQVFMLTLKEIRALPGDKVYLVDNLGNKSKEIKKSVLGKTYDAFNAEQDKYIVERYLEDINVLFTVDDVKSKDKITFLDKQE